jgi:hypothetical protein
MSVFYRSHWLWNGPKCGFIEFKCRTDTTCFCLLFYVLWHRHFYPRTDPMNIFSTRTCGGCRMLAWYGPNGKAKQYRMTGHHEVTWKLRWVPVWCVLCNVISSHIYIGDSKLWAAAAFYAHWVPRICCITLRRLISDHVNFWALQIEEMPKLINCESKFL